MSDLAPEILAPEPIVPIVPKRVRWTSRVGQLSTGLPNIPRGEPYYRAYQKSSGSKKNSGGTGKRGNRWYQGRFTSKKGK